MTHICVSISKLTTIVSHNSLLPGRHQAIVWTNAGISLIGPLGTNFCEFLIETDIFSSREMHLRMSSGKWQPFCLGLSVLIDYHQLSDIDPIDSSYMVLNNTINDSDLWQQGGLSQLTLYACDSSQEIYFHFHTHVCNGKWLVSMSCDVLHEHLLQSAIVNVNKAIQWLGSF